MRIAVFGTGTVGRTLAGRLSELGHSVVIGTRDPASTLARTDPDAMGNPPFAAWQADHRDVRLATFADAAAGAELAFVATSGAGALDAVGLAGAGNLAGKVVVDVSNALDFSGGFPPALFVQDTDSLAERIQRTFPEARVVKTLNTLTAPLMVDPGSLGESTTIFVSGNDGEAKATVLTLLQSFGHDDVIDLGQIDTARGPEMMMAMWLRIMGALGTAAFNYKIVRAR